MPSFEIPADIFTRLSVFDSPKGSSNTFKARKKYQPVFQKRHLIIYNSSGSLKSFSYTGVQSKKYKTKSFLQAVS